MSRDVNILVGEGVGILTDPIKVELQALLLLVLFCAES
jgi:hypothetical protein